MPATSLHEKDKGFNALLPLLQKLRNEGTKVVVAETHLDNATAAQITAAGAVIVTNPNPSKLNAALVTLVDPRQSEKKLR